MVNLFTTFFFIFRLFVFLFNRLYSRWFSMFQFISRCSNLVIVLNHHYLKDYCFVDSVVYMQPQTSQLPSFDSQVGHMPVGQSSGFYPTLPTDWHLTTMYSMDERSPTPTNYETSSEIDSSLLRKINVDEPHVLEFPPGYVFPGGIYIKW